MRVPGKILLVWLVIMWIVFSIWVIAVTPFPLNFGFVAWQFLTGLVFVWTLTTKTT